MGAARGPESGFKDRLANRGKVLKPVPHVLLKKECLLMTDFLKSQFASVPHVTPNSPGHVMATAWVRALVSPTHCWLPPYPLLVTFVSTTKTVCSLGCEVSARRPRVFCSYGAGAGPGTEEPTHPFSYRLLSESPTLQTSPPCHGTPPRVLCLLLASQWLWYLFCLNCILHT